MPMVVRTLGSLRNASVDGAHHGTLLEPPPEHGERHGRCQKYQPPVWPIASPSRRYDQRSGQSGKSNKRDACTVGASPFSSGLCETCLFIVSIPDQM
eukprot:SAG11_NODE_2971_length_2801_cov_2.645078_2_plen_97_part_00